MKLEIEYIPISEIKLYPNNAKIHTAEQIEQIKKSIQEFGFNDPIGIWHGECVEGHGRIIAATELGLERVPVIRLDELSDEQRKAYMLVHNKLTMNTDFDLDLLDLELDNISDIDMNLYGFDFQTLDDKLNSGQHQIDLSESWEVVIECNSEDEQQHLYNRMTEEGWKCRLSTL